MLRDGECLPIREGNNRRLRGVRGLAFGPLDLSLFNHRRDCAYDRPAHLVSEIEHVVQRPRCGRPKDERPLRASMSSLVMRNRFVPLRTLPSGT